jgi:hypothetical protein
MSPTIIGNEYEGICWNEKMEELWVKLAKPIK